VSAPEFVAELSRSGDQAVIRLSGELEDESAAQARDAFERALSDRPERLLVDLSGLEFMGSTGIWVMVEAHRRCVEAGIQLRLEGKPLPAVAQALALSGMEELTSAEPPSADRHDKAGEPIELRLYLSKRSTTSAAIVNTVRSVSERLPGADLRLEVIDVFEEPARAKRDRVIATPTLIKIRPGPELRLIGSVADPDAILRHLGLADIAARGTAYR
jgi:circadian clock protein KaiB